MMRIALLLITGSMALAFLTSQATGSAAAAETQPPDGVHGLALSEMRVAITSQDYTATFQLYETRAAKEFYEQLPLTLDLENFRDAQWMFYPPEKLNVTAKEA